MGRRDRSGPTFALSTDMRPRAEERGRRANAHQQHTLLGCQLTPKFSCGAHSPGEKMFAP